MVAYLSVGIIGHHDREAGGEDVLKVSIGYQEPDAEAREQRNEEPVHDVGDELAFHHGIVAGPQASKQ